MERTEVSPTQHHEARRGQHLSPERRQKIDTGTEFRVQHEHNDDESGNTHCPLDNKDVARSSQISMLSNFVKRIENGLHRKTAYDEGKHGTGTTPDP